MATRKSVAAGLGAGGFGLGAGLMYFLDPERGGRRRAILRDKVAHLANEAGDALDVTSRDLAHRAKGFLAMTTHSVRSTISGEVVPDQVIEARVRSRLGRLVSHPHAIHVSSRNGHVLLSGIILSHELDHLLKDLSKITGVFSVENRLERHKTADHIPSLQGGSPRAGTHWNVFQLNWSPATRFLMGTGGASLILYGNRLHEQRFVRGLLSIFGMGILARSLTNMEFKSIVGLGRRRSLVIHKNINVNAPMEQVFRFWSNFENYPRFMTDILDVRMSSSGVSHWTIQGPAGAPISWGAVTTRFLPNELIAWKSQPGSVIPNAGRVRFRKNEKGGTRIDLDFAYSPPGGELGEIAAMLFGASPKSKLESALAQMKTLIEKGPSERQVVGLH